MANVQTSIDINAPLERVWELVTDLKRTGDWVSIHRDFPTDPPAEVAVGTRFQQTLAVAGTPFGVEWTAVEVDSPQRLTWEGVGPAGTTARTTYSLAAENGGTRFTYDNDFKLPAGEVGKAAAKVVSSYAEQEANTSLASLKKLADG